MINPNFLPPGHLLHHRYSIQQSLGQGGFGITYLAYDQKLDQEVCIKELFVSGNSTRGSNFTVQSQSTRGFSLEEFVQRFVQEARQLARFQHPNIVRVIDIFQENGTAYTVMEYVKGETLKSKVSLEGALGEKEAMSLISQLLDAVEEVHNKGMLHRDIKPDNVLITPEGRVVLIDFGSAREFAEGKTTTQTAMLTPGFAPPEQYSTRAQRGPYTDIYALGATMYFLMTGEKPIPVTDRSLEELIAPHQLVPSVSSQVSSAVMLAMEIKPENRFQQVSDMREALKILERRKEIPAGKPEKKAEEVIAPQQKPFVNKGKVIGGKIAVAVFVLFFGIGTSYLIYSSVQPPVIEGEQTGLADKELEEAIRRQQEQDQTRKQEEQRHREQQEQEQRRKQEEQIQKEHQQLEEIRTQEQLRNTPAVQNLRNDMVLVQGGTFTMGCTSEQGNDCFDDEKPAHQVTLRSFYISKYEVTQELWQVVMGSNPPIGFEGCDRCPVVYVSWNGVQEFIRKLNQISGNNYRLPTEAEWEYAARGGSASRGYKYSGGNNPEELGWYKGNSSDKTHPVGRKMANELGLYDMSGNVLEMCSDWYGDYSSGSQSNPLGPSSGSGRVCRGGSWSADPKYLRVPNRLSFTSGNLYGDIGFRLALSLQTEPSKTKSVEQSFSCDNWDIRSRPYIIGCQSSKISEIQSCLGLESNGIFNKETERALFNIKADVSKGITAEIYNRIMRNCGRSELEASNQTLSNSQNTNEINSNQIHDVVDKQPNPPGGMSGWNGYLSKNLRYPTQARRMGIEGTVIVVFVINTDGSIQDVELFKGIGGGCDEEAIRVIQNSPIWEHGQVNGYLARVRVKLPIRFKLS